MLKFPSQLFSAFQNRSPSAQQKCLSARKPGSSSDVWIQFERNFYHRWIWQSVHALEIYHLFSRGLWGAHTALCTWKSMSSDRSSQPSALQLARPILGRCLWLDKSKSLIYTGGHNSYRSVYAWLEVVRSRNQTYTVWVTMVRQRRAPIFEIARFANKEKTGSCSLG